MKVKIFSEYDRKRDKPFRKSSTSKSNLEQEINLWLGNNPSIEIKNIIQTSTGGSYYASTHLISVWYDIID